MVRIEKEGLKTSISICNQLLHAGPTEGEEKEISGGKEGQKERHVICQGSPFLPFVSSARALGPTFLYKDSFPSFFFLFQLFSSLPCPRIPVDSLQSTIS
jgi:hypothetical protein